MSETACYNGSAREFSHWFNQQNDLRVTEGELRLALLRCAYLFMVVLRVSVVCC